MVQWSEIKTAFNRRLISGRMHNTEDIIDPIVFLKECKFVLIPKVGQYLFEYQSPVKMACDLCCEYIVKKGDKETIFHSSTMMPFTLSDDFTEWFEKNVSGPIHTNMDEFQEGDSGKALSCIKYLQANICKFDPMHGGSSYIDLPDKIKNKRAVVNVQNKDEKCFVWSLLSALYPPNNDPQLTTKYPQDLNQTFNLLNIDFPTPLADILKFENQNDISVNVYGLEFDMNECDYVVVGPLHYTKKKKNRHVNLLYFKQEQRSHYAWIKSLSRLLSSQLSKNRNAKFICDRCLQYFGRVDLLQKHEEDCALVDAVKIEMPNEEEKWLKFRNHQRKERHPFVIYADVECLTTPVQTCQPDTNHVPCAIGYQLVCSYDASLSLYEGYRGPEPVVWFMDRLKIVIGMVRTFYMNIAKLEMTDQNYVDFNLAETCHICGESFEDSDDQRKVRDHCHLSGKFRGAAHNICNLQYQLPDYIPVFFHNLSGNDSHLFIKELGADGQEIKLIPANEERYISFSKKVNGIELRFLDSYRFMNSALDKLVSYMDLNEFKLVREHYPENTKFKLMTRIGVFPYDYVNSWDRLEETKTAFHSTLNNQDYIHAQTVWNLFKHETLGDYLELYVQPNVLLLADVFENFRDICLNSYDLDPAHYYTTPGLAWDAMLKMTGVQLELLTDIDMLLFFERGIRGGISQCCNRYAKANNHYMTTADPTRPHQYDRTSPEKYLMYFDACNSYGWAMTQCLPHSCFDWLTDEQIYQLDFNAIPENGPNGYIFEVDLEYPQHLHDKHTDLPLCPEQKGPGSKLLTTLYDKNKYIIHYRNLKQALQLGMKLTKVHRGIRFQQSYFMQKYIDINTNFRKLARNEFESNFYKFMNCAVFGKSIENIRKHCIVKLVSKWDGRGGARKLVARPNFKRAIILTSNLAGIELNKVKIKFNKPVYLGMAILDISKHLMYDFHYNYIHNTYINPKLLYMDTDSLIYEFTHDPYIQIAKDIHRYDTSNYPLGNRYGIPQANKKVVGLFKDENAGLLMTEFAGLRAKMYSFALENDILLSKRDSGVVNIDDYKNVLFNKTNMFKKQKRIVPVQHDIVTVEQNKLTLSADDDKRYMLHNSTDTLPWGHYRIPDDERELGKD